MVKSEKLLLSVAGAGLKKRALAAVRPGVEVMLLAAVALGCAQAGWSILTPSTAGAYNPTNEGDAQTARLDAIDIVSPFEPNIADGDQQSQAVAALLSGVQLSGLRQASASAPGGAVLTLNDGAQRAFAVGQEISAGVSLAEVGADYVLISYTGGQRQISMSAGPSYSFARAMMGLEPAPGAPQAQPQIQPEPAQAAGAAPAPSARDVAWLQATLAQVEQEDGAAAGAWPSPCRRRRRKRGFRAGTSSWR